MEALVKELNTQVATLNGKLRPMVEKVRSGTIDSTKHGMTYLEMKYNLLLSYCSFLSFYIVLKTTGRKIEGHPVVGRLIHVKTLLERLRPLD